MKKNLFAAARDYVSIIEQMEKTSDPSRLQKLEEMRAKLHWEFIELLKEQGIPYTDREHVTRIAFKIAREEL